MAKMSKQERETFLADVHVGVLSIERRGRGPLAVPIWYLVDQGDVLMLMDGRSLKAKLLWAASKATLTVQEETRPYRYVSVDGPVTLDAAPPDLRRQMAVRYLGEDAGAKYASAPDTANPVVVRLTPTTWNTTDYARTVDNQSNDAAAPG